jgi:hypothetical protein
LVLGLALIAALVIGVFRVKDETAAAARDVRGLEAEVAAAKQERAVLRAERQYLESPARLERLSEAALGAEAADPGRSGEGAPEAASQR